MNLWDPETGELRLPLPPSGNLCWRLPFRPTLSGWPSGPGMSIGPPRKEPVRVLMPREIRLLCWTAIRGSFPRSPFRLTELSSQRAIADESIKLWDLATRKEVLTFDGHSRPVNSLAFAGSGQVVAVRQRRPGGRWKRAETVGCGDRQGFGDRSRSRCESINWCCPQTNDSWRRPCLAPLSHCVFPWRCMDGSRRMKGVYASV